MPRAKVTEDDFIRLFESCGAAETARRLNVAPTNVFQRRRRIEAERGIEIRNPVIPNKNAWTHVRGYQKPQALHAVVENGVVLVGSDSHYWPGIVSTAHRAFVKFCRTLKPSIVIKNGDELDCARLSPFPAIGWARRPTMRREVETAKLRLREIAKASGVAERYWPLGNHDARFETRLVTFAPDYARRHGVHLGDHFPDWTPCWSVWINGDTVVKHRFKGGLHATTANALWSGKNIVTGHLHACQARPLTDYNGTRWGVDCGTLADIYGPQFNDYLEDNPRNWRSGFAVLTFRNRKMLQPELVLVHDETHVDFRGQLIEV